MIQLYDYDKFYNKNVEIMITRETDLIQFLDNMKLLYPRQENYYEHFEDYTPYYPLYMRVRFDEFVEGIPTYFWIFDYEPTEGYQTISYKDIIAKVIKYEPR